MLEGHLWPRESRHQCNLAEAAKQILYLHPDSGAISRTCWQGLVWPRTCFCFAHLADHPSEAEGSWYFKAEALGKHQVLWRDSKGSDSVCCGHQELCCFLPSPKAWRTVCGKKHVFFISCIALHCCLCLCTNVLTNLLKLWALPASCPFGCISPVPSTTVCFYLQKNKKRRDFFFHIWSAVQSFLGFHSGQRHSKSTSKILLRLLRPIIFTSSFPAQPKQLLPFCL